MSWNDLVGIYNAQVQALVEQAQKDKQAQVLAIQEAQEKIRRDIENNIQLQKDRVDAIFQYQQWVGYLFANPTKNGIALDDFKRRAFQPTCMFRRDWYNYNPTTANSFMGVATANEANAAYNKFLVHLSRPNGAATPLLDDARSRFFTDDCAFLNPRDLSDYSRNLSAVFK